MPPARQTRQFDHHPAFFGFGFGFGFGSGSTVSHAHYRPAFEVQCLANGPHHRQQRRKRSALDATRTHDGMIMLLT